jgi:hypothetical protein
MELREGPYTSKEMSSNVEINKKLDDLEQGTL